MRCVLITLRFSKVIPFPVGKHFAKWNENKALLTPCLHTLVVYKSSSQVSRVISAKICDLSTPKKFLARSRALHQFKNTWLCPLNQCCSNFIVFKVESSDETGYSVPFEFQINNKQFFYRNMFQKLCGIYLKFKNVI